MKLEKQQYFVDVELNAPVDKCFNATLDPKIMKQWIPNVKEITYDHSAAEAPYHAGSVRDITMSNDLVIKERITHYQPPNYYAYEIGSMGKVPDMLFGNYHGIISFEAIDENKTRFTWQGDFDCKGLQKITEPLVRHMIRKAIHKMAANIEQYFTK